MNKDFAGGTFPTEIGEIYGARLWRMSKQGRLLARSVVAPPWEDGENQAVCVAEPRYHPGLLIDPTGQGRRGVDLYSQHQTTLHFPMSDHMSAASATITYTDHVKVGYKYQVTWSDGSTELYDSVKMREPEKHSSPWEACTCGFYAYTEADHSELDMNSLFHFYAPTPLVQGVIKGYGNTLIGSRGFRCEKAEIAALLSPTSSTAMPSGVNAWVLKQLELNYPSAVIVSSAEELDRFATLGLS